MGSPSADPFSTLPDPSALDAEIDASLENDIDMTVAPEGDAPAVGFDGTAENPLDPSNPELDPPLETRIPARKDMSLREFMGKMDEYAPIVGISYKFNQFLPRTTLRYHQHLQSSCEAYPFRHR